MSKIIKKERLVYAVKIITKPAKATMGMLG